MNFSTSTFPAPILALSLSISFVLFTFFNLFTLVNFLKLIPPSCLQFISPSKSPDFSRGCGFWVCVSSGLETGWGTGLKGRRTLTAGGLPQGSLLLGLAWPRCSSGSCLGMMSGRIIWCSVPFLKELPFACFYGTIFWHFFFSMLLISLFSLYLMAFISLRFWTWPENEGLVEGRWARHHQMYWGSGWGHGEDSR